MKSLDLYFYCVSCHITLTLICEITSFSPTPRSASQNEMSQSKSTDNESATNPVRVTITIPNPEEILQNSSLLLKESKTKGNGTEEQRIKRNIGQLAYLIHFHTRYNWKRLLNYGNWCGLGGNRAGDNSVIDLCDSCCKQHDICYHLTKQAKGIQQSPFVFFPVIGLGFDFNSPGQCNPYADFYSFTSALDPYLGGTIPVCADHYGTCARRVCHCDVEFVKCLRRSRCRAH